MKIYRIIDWEKIYENNRSRELKKLDWFAMPNKQDGDGYTSLVSMENGAALFGAWCAVAQIASRCDVRGTLMRDNGKPHNAQSLARMSRLPAGIIQDMLNTCLSEEINWLETIELNEVAEKPASFGDNPAPSCDIPASGCLEGKGKKGKKEGDGKEPPHPPAFSLSNRIALEKELTRIANEIKTLGTLADHDKGTTRYNRLVTLQTRQQEIRKQLGVVA